MRTAILVVLALTLLVGFSTGCCWRGNSGSTEQAACSCPAGTSGGTTWCSECNVGYVAGEKTHCGGCYTAKNGGPACQACAGK